MLIDDKEHPRITTSIHSMQDRIIALDILKGIAVLGIFWVNIQSFSAPFAAYANPTVHGTGVFITTIGVMQNLKHGFSLQHSSDVGSVFNCVGSLMSAIGYIALIMLFVQSQHFTRLKSALANMGKMAFTNYIMQSVIASLVLYGFGLNYFAEVSRANHQGPLENVMWRLTYR